MKSFLQITLALSLFSFLLGSCHSGKKSKISDEVRCSFFLHKNSTFWKKDSIGSNGYRSLAAQNIQKMKCDLMQYSQEEIESFFGSPNYKIDHQVGYMLRYQLTNLGYLSRPGQEYLDISIDGKGHVKEVRFWVVDG